ncbi:MAG: alkaline phosphatase D family protein [Microthrixaceae bacterium]|nr:alkaline phosphatase D family protein [Microthrixaceae bacterium]
MDEPISRRRVLAAAGATGAVAALRPLVVPATPAGAQGTPGYPDAVAAGDPLPDGSVIWTRLAPPADRGDVALTWAVRPEGGGAVAASGAVTAVEAHHWCVSVPVGNLEPDRWYTFTFDGPDGTSPEGRLRTAPAAGASPQHLRFAFGSCQQRSSPYVAMAAIEAEDVDFFVHLGDYIYVSDTGTITLDDYREVWRRFHSDPALTRLRSRVPIVAMWDDGEFYNGVDRTGDPARLAAAKRAFFEFQPTLPSDGAEQAYRAFHWGDLATVPIVDVRSYRDPAVEATDNETPEGAVVMDPGRTTLGAEQKAWLKDLLATSDATWKLVGTSYNVLAVRLGDTDTPERRAAEPDLVRNAGNYYPNEAFDDYQAERRELMEYLVDECIEDVVFVSGHTHVFLGGRLYPDYDDAASPLAAHEFVAGSLTADPPPEGVVRSLLGTDVGREEAIALLRNVEAAGLDLNAHLDYINIVEQGYGLVDVTPDEVHVQFRVIDTFADDAVATTAWDYRIARGTTPSACAATPPDPIDPQDPPGPSDPDRPAGPSSPGAAPSGSAGGSGSGSGSGSDPDSGSNPAGGAAPLAPRFTG